MRVDHNELVAGSKKSVLCKSLNITIEFSPSDKNLQSIYKFATINITAQKDSL